MAELARAGSGDSGQELRKERAVAWLRVAVPAVLGEGDPLDLCRQWSLSADLLLKKAFAQCFAPTEAALFALGKLGSYELNLSSDVDLLIVSDREDPDLIQSLRKFQRLLADITAEGFVFRVDFDLRPGGRMGPLVPTADQLMDYYGNYGETWERLAFVRLRFIAGADEIASRVLAFTRRFTYRRHIDFSLLEDLKNLRGRMLSHNWKRAGPDEIDLKLALGGIRDIELFTHAMLVIHGGKEPSLQVSETRSALKKLSEKERLPAAEASFLSSLYSDLRRLENYVQAIDDRQTHLLSRKEPHPTFVNELLKDFDARMLRSREIVSELLGDEDPGVAKVIDIPEDLHRELMSIPLLSRNKERDEETRRKFLALFMELLDRQGGRRDWALEQLRDFLKAVRAKSSFFSLLVREVKLIEELAWLFGHSRYLGRLLCYRPELLDSFAYRSQSLRREDLSLLLEDLAEKKLLGELVEGSRFLRDLDAVETTRRLSTVADEIGREMACALKKEYPSDCEVLCLGKWGGSEMGFRSDLDFLFVTPGEVEERDHRFARRFISRLTEPHRGGSIYSIDLRLRPSGKAGPIVIPIADLKSYLESESAPWERQAYLRARWLERDLGDLAPSLFARTLTKDDLAELDRVRIGLVKPAPDVKYREGGLVDLEFCAQTLALQKASPSAGKSSFELLHEQAGEILSRNYERLRQLEQIMHLVTVESSHQWRLEGEIPSIVAGLLKTSPEALNEELEKIFRKNLEELDRLDPRRRPR